VIYGGRNCEGRNIILRLLVRLSSTYTCVKRKFCHTVELVETIQSRNQQLASGHVRHELESGMSCDLNYNLFPLSAVECRQTGE
jgi:hypothetical protein